LLPCIQLPSVDVKCPSDAIQVQDLVLSDTSELGVTVQVTVEPTSTGPLELKVTVGFPNEGFQDLEPQFTVPSYIFKNKP
jgi:hypothetical protein